MTLIDNGRVGRCTISSMMLARINQNTRLTANDYWCWWGRWPCYPIPRFDYIRWWGRDSVSRFDDIFFIILVKLVELLMMVNFPSLWADWRSCHYNWRWGLSCKKINNKFCIKYSFSGFICLLLNHYVWFSQFWSHFHRIASMQNFTKILLKHSLSISSCQYTNKTFRQNKICQTFWNIFTETCSRYIKSSTMWDFHDFDLTWKCKKNCFGWLHCLPQRLKLMFFENFSNGAAQKRPAEWTIFFSKNIDFSLWGKQCNHPKHIF